MYVYYITHKHNNITIYTHKNNMDMIERLSETYIKPSTPTPPSLRHHKLCLNSQFEKEYIPLAFFYPITTHPSTFSDELREKTSRVLETALSKTLSYYYLFAGRLKDNKYIECNDKGVYFSQVKFKFPLSHMENKREKSHLKAYTLPNCFVRDDDNDLSLLFVQVNYFECGGIALSISMNHKLGDISSLFTFYRDWASLIKIDQIKKPKFFGPSIFPPFEDPKLVKEVKMDVVMSPLRHLLFESTKLEELKNKVIVSSVEKPTRVEIVTALLYKCALEASKKVSGKFKPSGVVVTINLRPMMVPPLPNDVVGNLSVGLVIPTVKEEDVTLEKLVSKIRNEKLRVRDAYRKTGTSIDPSVGFVMDQMNMMSCGELETYVCSSWCRHPFYEVDFGRGKPTMVYFPDQAGGKNVFVLRDTKEEDGNIQVLASLDNQEMAEFLTNPELLAFASIEE